MLRSQSLTPDREAGRAGVAEIADFNADTKADILWRDTTSGAVVIWFMNGGTVLSNVSLGSVAASWQTQ